MQFCYRGTRYQAIFSGLEVTQSSVTGKYRGVAVRFTQISEVQQSQIPHQLKYRGVVYTDR